MGNPKKFDRALQRTLLEALAERYPQTVNIESLSEHNQDEATLKANLFYLAGHGLIEPIDASGMGRRDILAAALTSRGIDFLAEDGGLDAIYRTVTVKIHEDSLKSILALRIRQSTLEEGQKSRLLEFLGSLGAEGAKHLTQKAIDFACGHPSFLTHMLQSSL